MIYLRDFSHLAERPIEEQPEIIANHFGMVEKQLIYAINDNIFDHYKIEDKIKELNAQLLLESDSTKRYKIEAAIETYMEKLSHRVVIGESRQLISIDANLVNTAPFVLLRGFDDEIVSTEYNDESNNNFNHDLGDGQVRVYSKKDILKLSYDVLLIVYGRDNYLKYYTKLWGFLNSLNEIIVNNEKIQVYLVDSPNGEPENLETSIFTSQKRISLEYVSRWDITNYYDTDKVKKSEIFINDRSINL